jgi:hypothetical protein
MLLSGPRECDSQPKVKQGPWAQRFTSDVNMERDRVHGDNTRNSSTDPAERPPVAARMRASLIPHGRVPANDEQVDNTSRVAWSGHRPHLANSLEIQARIPSFHPSRPPNGPIEPLVIDAVVAADGEYIELVASSGHDRRRAPVCASQADEAGPPRAIVVVLPQRAVLVDAEKLELVEARPHDRGPLHELRIRPHRAHVLPRAPQGRAPLAVFAPLDVAPAVGADGEDGDGVGADGDRDGLGDEGAAAEGFPARPVAVQMASIPDGRVESEHDELDVSRSPRGHAIHW